MAYEKNERLKFKVVDGMVQNPFYCRVCRKKLNRSDRLDLMYCGRRCKDFAYRVRDERRKAKTNFYKAKRHTGNLRPFLQE